MGYVYKITNTVNNKAYIGISTKDPTKRNGRISHHYSGGGNKLIAMDLEKYGRDTFTHEIIAVNIFPELLFDLEIAYIQKFDTVSPNGYNLTHGGEGWSMCEEVRRKMSESKKGKKPSVETRRKISESLRGKYLGKDRGKNLGRKHTAETRRKMSEAERTYTAGSGPTSGRKHSEETKRKIAASVKQKWSKRRRLRCGCCLFL